MLQPIQVEQGTEEWFKLRQGIPTASRFSEFITKANWTYSESDTAKTYLYEMVCERILGRKMDRDKYDSPWMKHGRKYESQAAFDLEMTHKLILLPGGFFKNGRAGCSPDRTVLGQEEIVEIKCPAPWTHARYMAEGLGEAYEIQVQAQLWITEAKVCHFWSWWPEPNLPPLYVKRERNEIHIRKIEKLATRFSDDILNAEAKLYELGAFRSETNE